MNGDNHTEEHTRACRSMRERISRYIDGDLPERDRETLGSHLAECARCRREAEALRTMVAAASELPRIAAPEGMAAGAIARMKARPQGFWGVISLPVFAPTATAAAAAAVLIALIVTVYRSPSTSRQAVASMDAAEQAEEVARKESKAEAETPSKPAAVAAAPDPLRKSRTAVPSEAIAGPSPAIEKGKALMAAAQPAESPAEAWGSYVTASILLYLRPSIPKTVTAEERKKAVAPEAIAMPGSAMPSIASTGKSAKADRLAEPRRHVAESAPALKTEGLLMDREVAVKAESTPASAPADAEEMRIAVSDMRMAVLRLRETIQQRGGRLTGPPSGEKMPDGTLRFVASIPRTALPVFRKDVLTAFQGENLPKADGAVAPAQQKGGENP